MCRQIFNVFESVRVNLCEHIIIIKPIFINRKTNFIKSVERKLWNWIKQKLFGYEIFVCSFFHLIYFHFIGHYLLGFLQEAYWDFLLCSLILSVSLQVNFEWLMPMFSIKWSFVYTFFKPRKNCKRFATANSLLFTTLCNANQIRVNLITIIIVIFLMQHNGF